MDANEYTHGEQGGVDPGRVDAPVTERSHGEEEKTKWASEPYNTFNDPNAGQAHADNTPRYSAADGEPFSSNVDDGYETSVGAFEPVPAKKSTQTKRVVIIVVIAVVVMGLLAAAFMAFVLPRITGESNPVSDLVSGTQPPENTPNDVVAAFDKAFNENDRDAMANCFLPGQSLKRNTEGGVVQIINGIRGYFGSDNITAHFELESLTYDENDSTKATGRVKLSYTLPILGDMTKDLSATFKLENNKWYFSEFLDSL